MMLYFIHGLNGSAAEWAPFIEYFTEKGYDCTAVELQEGLNLRKIHFQDYINKVVSIVHGNDIVVGHSMGGMIVQKVAELTSIKAGVCICPSPPKGIEMKSISFLSQIRYIPFIIARIPFLPSFSLAQNHFLNDIPLEEAQIRYQQLKKQSAIVSYEVLKAKISVDETQVNCPLFFIARKNDLIISPEIVSRIAEKYNAPIRYLDGNHYIFSNFKPVADCIYDYIKDV
jgi:pimeloyl-ACP methyl ester carboxylesterase